jgi:hypothetical protein
MVANKETDTTKQAQATEIAVRWLFGQPFNNVLLIAILGAIAWGTRYGVTTAIPAHLKQIQDGYEMLDQSHKDERGELTKIYDKWFDRIESSHAAEADGPDETHSAQLHN